MNIMLVREYNKDQGNCISQEENKRNFLLKSIGIPVLGARRQVKLYICQLRFLLIVVVY